LEKDKFIKKIFEKYLKNECSPLEVELLFDYLGQDDNLSDFRRVISDYFESGDDKVQLEALTKFEIEDNYQKIIENISARPKTNRFKLKPYILSSIAVAATLAIISALVFQFHKPLDSRQPGNNLAHAKAYLPGSNKAFLQLSNGNRVLLNSIKDGTSFKYGGVTFVKNYNGEILCSVDNLTKPSSTETISLITPRGGKFKIVLTDGTQIWLNSASKLMFPNRFAALERNVVAEGEMYFEVAKRKAQPFIVNSGKNQIKVFGTHFNVTNYQDDRVFKATLLEGKVAVTNGTSSTFLQPGQQAISKHKDPHIKVLEVDTQQQIAWKNGLFSFKDTELSQVMRQISRWYDVDVKFENNPSRHYFTGKIRREAELTKVLEMLEFTGVRFKVEGKILTVQ